MYVKSVVLLCGVTAPWIATAALQPPQVLATSDALTTGIGSNTALRILPLGDSITWGDRSSDGNGYRLNLLDLLPQNPVQYVASQRSGDTTHNYAGGQLDAVIAEIKEQSKSSLIEPPNVVLLMAGTTDIADSVDLSTAPERLGSLVDELVTVYPSAVIIVSQLTPIRDAELEARAAGFNAAVPSIVSARASSGKHVLTVQMSDYVTVDDLEDGLHPTNRGYALMAQAWYDGIREAVSKGWLVSPASETSRNRKRTVPTTPNSSPINAFALVQNSETLAPTTTLTSTLISTVTVTVKEVAHLATTTSYASNTTLSIKTTSHTASNTTVVTSTFTSVPTFTSNNISISHHTHTHTTIFPSVSSITGTTPVSSSSSSSSPSSTSTAPSTNQASGFKGNLSQMVAGLVFFWISTMLI